MRLIYLLSSSTLRVKKMRPNTHSRIHSGFSLVSLIETAFAAGSSGTPLMELETETFYRRP
jgi:hypothetical protein